MTAQQAYRGGSGHDEIKEAYVYTYDRNSNIKSERIVSDYDRDSSGEGRDITRTYTYDELGRLTETREKKGSDETAEAEVTTYTYDKAGNRLTETKDGRTTSFSYNALDQLTESKSTEESRIYSYDRNGNQTSEITREGDAEKGRRSYAYDEADRLKNLTVKEEGRLILTQENSYNGEGQRISKAETKLTEDLNGETTETSKTDYFYQDGAVLYTKDADGNRSSMNLLGTSVNVIATSRGTGNSENWYLYNKDIRESTTSIIGANGSAAVTYKYDDFGNTKLTGGTGIDNEICYTGQIYDRSTGLYYYNARYYDPENARFLTQDTYRGDSTQPDTLHLYAYCANNPINYTDPSGYKKVNINKTVLHWWGRTNYLSYSNARNLRSSLDKYRTATDVIALIATGAGLFNAYIGAFAFANQVLSRYVGYFQKRIKKCNKKGKGIKYKIWWTMNFKMRTQGKKW